MLDVLFQYGPITLRTFNFFLAFGFLASAYFLMRYAIRKKMNFSFLSKNFFVLLLTGLLAGRLFEIFLNIAYFKDHLLEMAFIWDLDFNFFGIIYGTLGALWFLCQKYKEDFWAWLDSLVLAGLVALCFISIGYFFDGAQYGLPTSLPWGITFENIGIPFTTPIHPTQLYSALASFILFAYLMRYNKRQHQPGVIGTVGILVIQFTLLGIDFLHGLPSLYFKINALILAVLAFVGLVFVSHRPSTITK